MGTRRVSRIAPLQDRLALHRFVCREFGYDDLGGMLGRLGPACGEIAPGGEIDYAQALPPWPARARVSPDRIAEYDAAILACSRRLRMTGEDGPDLETPPVPRPAVHRALPAALLRRPGGAARRPEPFEEDARAVSGLAGLPAGRPARPRLPERHRLGQDAAHARPRPAVPAAPRPRRRASEQRRAAHAERADVGAARTRSGGEAACGRGGSPAPRRPTCFSPIEIIDLNKLAEKKGVKRVAVSDFGDDNLVLVDEGHLGASGKVWRERRKELSRGGFTFEYSATFNQVTGGKDPDLLRAYGKCLLFDYPYRQFHADGYGKDYAILNLPGGAQDENADMYLLGCLLTFHQQYWLWREHGARWRAFNPARPLWGAARQDGLRIEQGGSRDPFRRRPHPELPGVAAGARGRGAADDRTPARGTVRPSGRIGPRLLRRPPAASAAGRRPRLRRPVRHAVPRPGTAARRLPDRPARGSCTCGPPTTSRSGWSTWATRRRSTSCCSKPAPPTSTSTARWASRSGCSPTWTGPARP